MVTDAVLADKIAMLEKQRDEHLAIYHQAVGAIATLRHLKDLVGQKDHMTMEELGEALGGTVEAIEPLP